ncbi:hypothetical protein TNCT_70701 [Trichonephila clavata]|uniref:Uncharacterized protein n=1 Tax=Trichonephila clavata TaxID=2740835 RepID=A0A8X6HNC7_TRICU|nr:hypothetical protein TNCT_70701 [Trichonephila clavata]
MFKNCRKEDLRIVVLELGETVAEKSTIEDRKKVEETRLREMELELVRLQAGVKSENERIGEGCDSLNASVNSVRTLTVKVPNRPEKRAFFFSSLREPLRQKKMPEKFVENFVIFVWRKSVKCVKIC